MQAKEHGHAPSPLVPMAIKFIKAFFFLGLIFPLHHFTVDKVLGNSNYDNYYIIIYVRWKFKL